MSSSTPGKELDTTPLLNAILEKTKAGKLKWEETADEDVFIASVGGDTTLKVSKEPGLLVKLSLLSEQGKTVWEVTDLSYELDELFRLARRVALKVDEKVEALLETLQRL